MIALLSILGDFPEALSGRLPQAWRKHYHTVTLFLPETSLFPIT